MVKLPLELWVNQLLARAGSLRLRSMQKVEYRTDLGRLGYRMIKMMEACLHNLTHILFFGIPDMQHKTYRKFLSMEFPKLVSIGMGSLYCANPDDSMSEAITTFLVKHPLLQHLSLGQYRTEDAVFQFRGQHIHEKFLPNLKSFEGYPRNIGLLAQRRVGSLKTLIRLSLVIFQEESDHLRQVSNAVLEVFPQALSSVLDLRAEFKVNLTHEMRSNVTELGYRTCNDILAELCPNVTTWYGRLPAMSAGYLATMFANHEKLEIISLPQLSLCMNMPASEKSYFQPISQRCHHLKWVEARRPDYTELANHVYRLERDGGGDLADVRVEVVR